MTLQAGTRFGPYEIQSPLGVLKCQLKPVDRADYRVSMTPQQLQQLREVFRDGVCDYSKPGIGQQAAAGTYLTLPLAGR